VVTAKKPALQSVTSPAEQPAAVPIINDRIKNARNA